MGRTLDGATAASDRIPAPPGSAVSRGAEASLRAAEWWGFPALVKDRESKAYRPRELDERLRRERTRLEVRLLVEARRRGVRTPIVYDVDPLHHRIVLERLDGPTLKQLFDDPSTDFASLVRAVGSLGAAIGRLHGGGIAHGDLTSSNVLYPDGPLGPPALLDLSMGMLPAGLEELGIDLHLFEEDLTAIAREPKRLIDRFYAEYGRANPHRSAEIRERAREIRGRVRYS